MTTGLRVVGGRAAERPSGRSGDRLRNLLDRIEIDLLRFDLEYEGIARAEGPPADLEALLERVEPERLREPAVAEAVRALAEAGAAPALARPGAVRVEVSADAMALALAVEPPVGEGRPVDLDAARRAIAAAGVVHGLDEEALVRLLRRGAEEPVRGVVGRGRPPVRGCGETWVLVPLEASAHDEGDAERFDPRAARGLPAVEAGRTLARRLPAVEGRSGRDLLGREVPPPPPEPGRRLRAGEGTEERGGEIVATRAGEFEASGDLLSVSEVRVVPGDVDFSTGNVEFPGKVVVRGSILDRFVVRCGGDLVVGGSIQAAFVEAKGSIRVAKGIVGHDRGLVRAGGSVEARFIENARVEARGDVRVEKAILHSHVDASGLVEVRGRPGSVVGGRVRAGRGLRCRVLGAVAETRTLVGFGEDFHALRRRERIDEAIAFLRERLLEIRRALAAAAEAPDETFAARLGAAREKVAADLRALLAARLAPAEGAPAADAPRLEGAVEIADEVHAGVVLASRGLEYRIGHRLGASRFGLDGEEDRIAART